MTGTDRAFRPVPWQFRSLVLGAVLLLKGDVPDALQSAPEESAPPPPLPVVTKAGRVPHPHFGSNADDLAAAAPNVVAKAMNRHAPQTTGPKLARSPRRVHDRRPGQRAGLLASAAPIVPAPAPAGSAIAKEVPVAPEPPPVSEAQAPAPTSVAPEQPATENPAPDVNAPSPPEPVAPPEEPPPAANDNLALPQPAFAAPPGQTNENPGPGIRPESSAPLQAVTDSPALPERPSGSSEPSTIAEQAPGTIATASATPSPDDAETSPAAPPAPTARIAAPTVADGEAEATPLPTPAFGDTADHEASPSTPAPTATAAHPPVALEVLPVPAATEKGPQTASPTADPQPGTPRPTATGATAEPAVASAEPLPAPAFAQPASAHVRAGPPVAPAFGPDDELVLEMRTDKGGTSDTVIAYGADNWVYLPLGDLARMLDLAINVGDDGHFASGWFIDEKRTLSINLRDKQMLVEGRAVSLGPGDAVAFEGEMYIRAEKFANLFPLEVIADLRDQSVTIRTREPFPFEERLAREEKRLRLAGRDQDAPQRWPRQETPWKALDFPMADVELRGVSDNALGTRLEGDVRLAGDLAWLTAQAFVGATTRDGVVAARLEMGRRDPDGDLLGPLRATDFRFGDVATDAMPLGLRGTAGRGAFVTNAPIERVSVFDKVDLRGDLADGYEVELYRNGVLVGSTDKAVNGQYEFLHVPLDYGINLLKLVFYGPQGQRREETRRISVDSGQLTKGQFLYNVGVVQKDVTLFNARGPDFAPTRDYGTWRANAQIAYGLTSGVTVLASAARFGNAGRDDWQGSLGLRTGIAGFATRLDLAAQDRGARAVSLGLGGKLLGVSFTAGHSEYSGGFIDEIVDFTAEPLQRASQLDLNTTLRLGGGATGGGLAIPLSARFRRLERTDGGTETEASLRGSTRLGPLLASNLLQYSRTSHPSRQPFDQLLGSFDLATLSGSRTQVRAGLGYGIVPHPKLISAGVEVDHRIDEKTMVGASVQHGFTAGETRLGVSAERKFGAFSLGVDGSVDLNGRNYAVLARLGFSFGRNPMNGRMFVADLGMATSGAAAVRAFRDANGNGRFDTDEKALPEVGFAAPATSAESDSKGEALLSRIGAGTRATIQVDPDSLPDLDLEPVSRGIEVVPRPGRFILAEFPVVELSEMEGTVRFRKGGVMREISGLDLELVAEDGSVQGHSRTADGFYLFERIKPGRYTMRIEPAQAGRLHLQLSGDTSVTANASSAVVRRDFEVSGD